LNKQTQHYSDDRRKPAIKTGLAKVAVQCSVERHLWLIKVWFSASTFVLKSPNTVNLKIVMPQPKDDMTDNKQTEI
jgi:hypothetical protein